MKRRGLRWGIIVLLALFSLGLIAFGGYYLWEQHSGVAARLTVTECHAGHRSTSVRRHGFRRPSRSDNCFGTLVNQPRTHETSMKIWGAHRSDVGHDIDVHVHGHEAVANGWSVPLITLGVGCALGVGVLFFAVRGRRNNASGEWSAQ